MIPQIKRILYATDLSPNSIYALRYAMNSVLKHDAEVIILHVLEAVDPASQVMLDLYIDEKRHRKIVAERTAEAQKLIEKRLRTLRDKELKDHPEFGKRLCRALKTLV